jgi:hypothetical protein
MNLVLKNYLSQIAGDSTLESSLIGTVVRIRCELYNGENRISVFTAKEKSFVSNKEEQFYKAYKLYSQILEWLKSEELVVGLGDERYGRLICTVIHRAWNHCADLSWSQRQTMKVVMPHTLCWDISRRRGDRLGVVVDFAPHNS